MKMKAGTAAPMRSLTRRWGNTGQSGIGFVWPWRLIPSSSMLPQPKWGESVKAHFAAVKSKGRIIVLQNASASKTGVLWAAGFTGCAGIFSEKFCLLRYDAFVIALYGKSYS